MGSKWWVHRTKSGFSAQRHQMQPEQRVHRQRLHRSSKVLVTARFFLSLCSLVEVPVESSSFLFITKKDTSHTKLPRNIYRILKKEILSENKNRRQSSAHLNADALSNCIPCFDLPHDFARSWKILQPANNDAQTAAGSVQQSCALLFQDSLHVTFDLNIITVYTNKLMHFHRQLIQNMLWGSLHVTFDINAIAILTKSQCTFVNNWSKRC